MKRLALALAAIAPLAATADASHRAPPPPCDPASKRVFDLVTPPSLPTGYPGGFYLMVARPGKPSNPTHPGGVIGPTVPSVQPATPGGRLRHGFDGRLGRDRFKGPGSDDRWAFRFARGDDDARVTVTYPESHDAPGAPNYCTRTLSKMIRHERMRPSRVRVRKTFRRGSRVYVRGTIRRGRRRPILVRLYEGSFYRTGRRIRARNGRWSTSMSVYRFRMDYLPKRYQYNRFTARALYPGDVRDTWPCDDVFSSGVDDGCRRRIPHPPGVRP